MSYLLDTHALLWATGDSDRLSATARNIITTEQNLFVRIATFWEIGIKKNIGKLNIPFSLTKLAGYCLSQHITILPIQPAHIDALDQLPNIHGDPFDRLLIAQARTEQLILITKDANIHRYPVRAIW